MPFAVTCMDLEIVTLSEVSQTQKGKYHMILLICGIQKNGTNEPIYKTEIESQILQKICRKFVENKFMVTNGERDKLRLKYTHYYI